MLLKKLIIGSTAALLLASPVYAHSSMESANITNGSNYEVAPKSFELGFSKVVGLAKLSMSTEEGEAVAWDYEAPKTMQDDFNLPLPDLTTGQYVIDWSAISKDGHVMKEQIHFSVGLGEEHHEDHADDHHDDGHHEDNDTSHHDH